MLVPKRLRILISEHSLPNVPLDYKKKHLLISAGSKNEYYRRKSCKKEPETVDWLETNLVDGDVFWDIGANIGAYTMIAATLVGETGIVVAFEPEPSNFYGLNRNLRLNRLLNVTPLCVAVADSEKVFEIALSSFSPGSASHDWGLNDTKNIGVNNIYLRQKILCLSGDKITNELLVPPPRVLKIDVDGAEILVLNGLLKILRSTVEVVIIEVSELNLPQVSNILENLRFIPEETIEKYDAYNILYKKTN